MDGSMEMLEKILGREREALGKEYIAPVMRSRKVRIGIGSSICECSLDEEFSGWGVFTMSAPGKAELVREAEIWEKEQFVGAFPKQILILFYRDSNGIWWARDIGKDRFVPVMLVESQLQFDPITASFDGINYWYISPAGQVDPRKPEKLREALASMTPPHELDDSLFTQKEIILYSNALSIVKNSSALRADASRKKIEEALRLGEANLLEWAEVGSGYRVKWQKGHEVLITLVDGDLSIVSAGICLSGQDKIQDLASLASLISTKPRGVPYVGAENAGQGNNISEAEYYAAHGY